MTAPAGTPLRVGLTGGIASGKSTVAGLFAELGVEVIDADEAAREAVRPGSPALAEIAAAFGQAVLTPQGTLDRAAMRAEAFADPDKRRRLEAILHPRIRARIAERVAAVQGPYCIIEIPLLVESGWQEGLDRVLVVDATEQEQIARARTRSDLTAAQVTAIIRTQATRGRRLAAADEVIANHDGREALVSQVRELHEKYTRLARAVHG